MPAQNAAARAARVLLLLFLAAARRGCCCALWVCARGQGALWLCCFLNLRSVQFEPPRLESNAPLVHRVHGGAGRSVVCTCARVCVCGGPRLTGNAGPLLSGAGGTAGCTTLCIAHACCNGGSFWAPLGHCNLLHTHNTVCVATEPPHRRQHNAPHRAWRQRMHNVMASNPGMEMGP